VQRFRHIAIEGPIGVGKTGLADNLGARLLLEQPEENPFLRRSYEARASTRCQRSSFFS